MPVTAEGEKAIERDHMAGLAASDEAYKAYLNGAPLSEVVPALRAKLKRIYWMRRALGRIR